MRVGGDAGQGGGQQLLGRGHQLVHQLQLQRLARAEQLAFEQVGLGAHQAEQARHLGDAGGAGHQAQGHLGQAELDARVVHGDAVVAHQRHLPAAAQGRTVEAADHRDAQGFQRAKVLLHALDLAEGRGRIGRREPHRGLEVGAREEAGLGRCQHHALELGAVGNHARRGLAQVGLPLAAHGVDAGVRFVEGDERHLAVGGVEEFVADGLHGVLRRRHHTRSTMVAMPMPPPTHRVARP